MTCELPLRDILVLWYCSVPGARARCQEQRTTPEPRHNKQWRKLPANLQTSHPRAQSLSSSLMSPETLLSCLARDKIQSWIHSLPPQVKASASPSSDRKVLGHISTVQLSRLNAGAEKRGSGGWEAQGENKNRELKRQFSSLESTMDENGPCKKQKVAVGQARSAPGA